MGWVRSYWKVCVELKTIWWEVDLNDFFEFCDDGKVLQSVESFPKLINIFLLIKNHTISLQNLKRVPKYYSIYIGMNDILRISLTSWINCGTSQLLVIYQNYVKNLNDAMQYYLICLKWNTIEKSFKTEVILMAEYICIARNK